MCVRHGWLPLNRDLSPNMLADSLNDSFVAQDMEDLFSSLVSLQREGAKTMPDA
jgi:hypothetical protein